MSFCSAERQKTACVADFVSKQNRCSIAVSALTMKILYNKGLKPLATSNNAVPVQKQCGRLGTDDFAVKNGFRLCKKDVSRRKKIFVRMNTSKTA